MSRHVLLLLALLLAGPPLTIPPAAAPLFADTILTNARVYTVNARQPWAEAVAMREGTILAVGSPVAMAAFRGKATRVMDLGGRLVLPGFTDCHIHFLSGSMTLDQVLLDGSRDIFEIQKKLQAYAARHPGKGWILGRGWVYSAFGPEALPHKKYLDVLFPNRPVLLEGYDGHTLWANSKALQLAGITRETPDPPHGVIVRDAKTGEPTGALKEHAGALVERVVPKPTRAQQLAALRHGITEAHRAGLVRVHSAGGDFEVLDLYDELRRNGQLTLRFTVAYFLNPPSLTPEAIEKIATARARFDDDWIAAGAVKMMMDGVIESHTAAMLDPFSDDASQRGQTFWEPEAYRQAVRELDRRGLQIFTHAIGDAGVRLTLDAYEEAARRNGSRDARHRIEHIETISPQDQPRFGQLGVMASMQPLHAYPDENLLSVWARNAGVERASRGFSWRTIAQAGGRLAFGSDWPVVTLDPWRGLQNAVTRQTRDARPPRGWIPAERVSLEQGIEAYTLGAAIAGRREKKEGSIEPGKLADLIVLSQDLFRVKPGQIGQTRVLLTLVGGKIVYQAPSWTSAQSGKRPEGREKRR